MLPEGAVTYSGVFAGLPAPMGVSAALSFIEMLLSLEVLTLQCHHIRVELSLGLSAFSFLGDTWFLMVVSHLFLACLASSVK